MTDALLIKDKEMKRFQLTRLGRTISRISRSINHKSLLPTLSIIVPVNTPAPLLSSSSCNLPLPMQQAHLNRPHTHPSWIRRSSHHACRWRTSPMPHLTTITLQHQIAYRSSSIRGWLIRTIFLSQHICGHKSTSR